MRADRIIKNTYRTLMTRGIKGCYVYCTDSATADYIRSCLTEVSTAAGTESVDSLPRLHSSDQRLGKELLFKSLQKRDVIKFVNAVPLIDLKFAAGSFSDTQDFDLTNAEWVEIPNWVRPQPGLFIAQVLGESMNRRIPNGAWCLFKANPTGSREGKIVVAQHRSIHDPDLGGTYTIKLYSSKKVTNRMAPGGM